MKTIKDFVQEFEQTLKEYRHAFHQIPEESYKEFKTSEFVQRELTKLNIPYKIIGATAVVADTGSGGPIVGIRINMDGLHGCAEHTGVEHSAHGNCAHACGHDMELAWAMGIAHYYAQKDFAGTVRLVFQPAEEGGTNDPLGRDGGKFLADEGAFDGIQALYSFHVDPDMELGVVCAHNGVATVDAIDFEFRLKGVSSHLSRPHEGVNPKREFAEILLAVDDLLTDIKSQQQSKPDKFFFLLDASQASMGLDIHHPLDAEINTGPNGAIIRGSSRLWKGSDSSSLQKSLTEGLENIAARADVSLKQRNANAGCELILSKIAVATINDPKVTDWTVQAINTSGFKHLDEPKFWKDAAGWTSDRGIPVCHGYIGCGAASGKLHTDTFYPDEKALPIGLEIFIGSMDNALAGLRNK